MMKRLLICWLLAVYVQQAFAAAVPTRMQSALSGVIQNKVASRGFGANDPRVGATVTSTGSGLAGAAAGAVVVVVGGATAPAWITVGISIGMTYAVTLAADGLLKWIFGADGKVTIPGQDNPDNVPGGYAPQVMYDVAGSRASSLAGACGGYSRSSQGVDFLGAYVLTYVGKVVGGECHVFLSNTYAVAVDPRYIVTDQDIGNTGYVMVTGCAGISVAAVNGICGPSNFPDKGGKVYPTIGDALQAMPAPDVVKPLNPSIVADIANDGWRNAAAAPGYAGLPYDASDPITPADVQQWQQANPNSYPNVGDALSPQTASPGAAAGDPFTLPQSSPGGSAAPSTPTNPSTQPLENLGPDPGIGAPGLEATPTALEIMSPALNLFPSLKSFVVPSHNAECPKPSMTLFGKAITLDAHCAVLEGIRGSLFACMAVVWLLVSLFIVLRA